jgi:hypothetical protein
LDFPTLKIAFPTDQHVPYEDREAVELAMKVIADFDPDEIIVGSDGLDFYAVSKFDKDPLRGDTTKIQYEIDRWEENQRAWMSAAPRARRRFLIGNHEERLQRYLWRNPEIADLRSLKLSKVLEFSDLEIDGEPEQEIVYFDKVMFRHGSVVRKGSAMSAKAELEQAKFAMSVNTGHTHRGGTHYSRTRAGIIQANECFCLCGLQPHYDPGFVDWQQGTVLTTVGYNFLFIEPIPFTRRFGKLEAVWRGKLYQA